MRNAMEKMPTYGARRATLFPTLCPCAWEATSFRRPACMRSAFINQKAAESCGHIILGN